MVEKKNSGFDDSNISKDFKPKKSKNDSIIPKFLKKHRENINKNDSTQK